MTTPKNDNKKRISLDQPLYEAKETQKNSRKYTTVVSKHLFVFY